MVLMPYHRRGWVCSQRLSLAFSLGRVDMVLTPYHITVLDGYALNSFPAMGFCGSLLAFENFFVVELTLLKINLRSK